MCKTSFKIISLRKVFFFYKTYDKKKLGLGIGIL